MIVVVAAAAADGEDTAAVVDGSGGGGGGGGLGGGGWRLVVIIVIVVVSFGTRAVCAPMMFSTMPEPSLGASDPIDLKRFSSTLFVGQGSNVGKAALKMKSDFEIEFKKVQHSVYADHLPNCVR